MSMNQGTVTTKYGLEVSVQNRPNIKDSKECRSEYSWPQISYEKFSKDGSLKNWVKRSTYTREKTNWIRELEWIRGKYLVWEFEV